MAIGIRPLTATSGEVEKRRFGGSTLGSRFDAIGNTEAGQSIQTLKK